MWVARSIVNDAALLLCTYTSPAVLLRVADKER